MTGPVLEVEGLRVTYTVKHHELRAVDGVDLVVRRGETLALVGESGCGKSTTGLAILRLVPLAAGRIRFAGQDLTARSERELRPLRRRMQIVFQDPLSAMNPRRRVGQILREPLRHLEGGGSAHGERVAQLLADVELPAELATRYPHELSGGQRQRVAIARALATGPDLIVADEPVSALDVSIQAQVVNLLLDLQERLGLAYVFISHDLAIVRHVAHRVAVMYLGTIVEEAPVRAVVSEPLHPYTRALVAAAPTVDATAMEPIPPGDPPDPSAPPSGCRFHPRCPYAQPTRCADAVPPLRSLETGHKVACHWAEEIRAGRIQPAATRSTSTSAV